MKLIVDRFEEEYVVCEKEDKTFINILKQDLPYNIKENDILEYNEQTQEIIKVDQTIEEKEEFEDLIKDLWK